MGTRINIQQIDKKTMDLSKIVCLALQARMVRSATRGGSLSSCSIWGLSTQLEAAQTLYFIHSSTFVHNSVSGLPPLKIVYC